MWRVIITISVMAAITVGGFIIYEYTKEEPYEDLYKVAQNYKNAKLKERHSDFLIESSDDVQFIDRDKRWEVRYGKSIFFLYKETKHQEHVKEYLKELEIELKRDLQGNLHVFYKEEEIPTYVNPR